MIKLKKVMILSIIFVLTLLLLPAASLALFDRDEKPVAKLVSQSCLSFGSEGSHSVTVTVPETGERETMSETEYLCGVVASQMPPDYDDEAIKAQAVASYSVLKYRKLHGETEAQSFITKKQMKQKWGKDYAGNYSRIKELVGQVNGEYLAYISRKMEQ